MSLRRDFRTNQIFAVVLFSSPVLVLPLDGPGYLFRPNDYPNFKASTFLPEIVLQVLSCMPAGLTVRHKRGPSRWLCRTCLEDQ